MVMKRICVYCGSSPGISPVYTDAAQKLGRTLAQRAIGLVYGGGRVGIMWEIANAVLEAGGQVIGVIPRDLFDKEVAFTELNDLRIVDSMHERKALMAELADGFIALPGGLGTLEEFCEALTWAQLDLHQKPCGLLNVEGFYSAFVEFLKHIVTQGFLQEPYLDLILSEENPQTLLERMSQHVPPVVDKIDWIRKISHGYNNKYQQ